MDDTARPIDRWAIYEMVGRFSDVASLQRIANRAAADIASLIALEEINRAVRASAVMVGAMLLRAATPAGSEGLPAATDLEIEERMAVKLDEVGATVAAAMVRASVAFERGAEAGAPSPSGALS